jgi:hypothetical protein
MTPKQAKSEAKRRLKDNNRLNARGGQSEWFYSPSKATVGCRIDAYDCDSPIRIVNLDYPYYGKAHLVDDWESVGVELSKEGWHWRRVGQTWMQFPNRQDSAYTVNVNGMLVEDSIEGLPEYVTPDNPEGIPPTSSWSKDGHKRYS